MKTVKKLVLSLLIAALAICGVSGPHRTSDPVSDTAVLPDVSMPPKYETAFLPANNDAAPESVPSDNNGSSSSAEEAQPSDPADPYDNDDPLCIAEADAPNFGKLLKDLVYWYEMADTKYLQAIEDDLDAIMSVSRKDYAVACSIKDHWLNVYMNRDYKIYRYSGGDTAPELEGSGIPDSRHHAIVVPGYELDFGQMREELKARCDAAAAFARSYPSSIIVCSGGATGSYNPDKNTEAGLMKKYLVENHGIEASRIYTDEESTNTQENAENTMRILQANGIETMTVVTSSYHQRRGQAVYNAAAQLFRAKYGYAVEIVANYNFGNDMIPEQDDRLTARQIGVILGLPWEIVDTIPQRTRSYDENADGS